MKYFSVLIFLSLMVSTYSAKSSTLGEFPVLEGPYLGQSPPGLTPEIFAPGVVSINGRYEHGISFSPDLNEVYFAANKEGEAAQIFFSRVEDEKWSPLKKANLTEGKKAEELHPSFSTDGKRLYFTAAKADLSDTGIWYVDREKDSWSKAKKLESSINDDKVFYPNQGVNGDLYYFNISKRKNYYAPDNNGEFSVIKELNIEFGIHVHISPSEDYLVMNARNREDESRKDSDIYVLFKKRDGSWTSPINLGSQVNSHFPETAPSITPDGKYLFFGRYNEEGGLSNFYWVSTKVIENLRP